LITTKKLSLTRKELYQSNNPDLKVVQVQPDEIHDKIQEFLCDGLKVIEIA
jgi:hypothetical protein